MLAPCAGKFSADGCKCTRIGSTRRKSRAKVGGTTRWHWCDCLQLDWWQSARPCHAEQKKKKLSGEQTTNDRTRERLCAASRGGTKDSGAKLEPGSVGLRDKERPIDVRVDTVRVPAAVVARNHSTNTCCNSRHYNRLQPKRSHTRSIPRMFLSLAGRAHLEKSSREQTFFLYHPDRRYNPPGAMR